MVVETLSFRALTQTVFSDPANGVHGNCLATCVAAITGEDVPNFAQFGRSKWFLELWKWGDEYGWDIYTARPDDLTLGFTIAQGDGPRGFKHAVLWVGGSNGMVAWDPHPDRTGLIGRPKNWIRLKKQ